MNPHEILKGSHWTCQWKCPACWEENGVCKHNISQDILSPIDLNPYLICRACSTHLADLGGMIVLSSNRPHRTTSGVVVSSPA